MSGRSGFVAQAQIEESARNRGTSESSWPPDLLEFLRARQLEGARPNQIRATAQLGRAVNGPQRLVHGVLVAAGPERAARPSIGIHLDLDRRPVGVRSCAHDR